MNPAEIDAWNRRVAMTHEDRVRLSMERLLSVPPPARAPRAEDFRDTDGPHEEANDADSQ